ncbi:peptide-methionine (S)-S-oxide reductase MsrA [Pseudoalteromonas sp. T1lg65]|uniref:peptide-methionine (S)-S-oxide reductase MsrA n=1 Tax=Pseudoalteromonas sp. T1lg65 TaxID=2077101 RepID=UPI003F7A746E
MQQLATATFGGGCFWCIDAAFRRVRGIESVSSGYTGGHTDNPTYQTICQGDTGHAEVVQLTFNPERISFELLLEMFFTLHDPTQLNKQGNDIGTQYRSVVFYHDQSQQQQTMSFIERLQASLDNKIVTEVSPISTFYPAEQYHQDYYEQNPNQGYCSVLIAPKLAKFAQRFESMLKA